MDFPGRIIRIGEKDKAVVRAIAKRLKKRGVAVSSPEGVFDAAFRSAVRLYQSQHFDVERRPLTVDGEVGPMTWGALFGVGSLPAAGAGGGLALAALAKAVSQIGVMEDPVGSNMGREVEEYLKSTGLPGGHFWCMAFVHWCFQEAAKERGVPNPFPRTAGVLRAWNDSAGMRISKATALANPARVTPGAVFIIDFGTGMGHTGFVRANNGGVLTTVEGNTNPTGSSNGIGVFELKRRNIANGQMKGFILVP